MNILLIGSDPEILYLTAKILRRNRYEVTVAVGKAQALQLPVDTDLVLFDCEMSSTDRDEIIHAVKASSPTPSLLLISSSREDEIPALLAGADDWVQKPYPMDVLFARMAALLRHKAT